METKKDEKKKKALPKSFMIAAATVILTITAGVVIALYLGKMTQRGPKQEETNETTPTPTQPVNTTPFREESMQESSQSGKESTGSGSFESFLNLQKSQEASASGPQVSTESALPSP